MDSDNGLYVVTATGVDARGRSDAATGAVSIRGLQGEALANALMKAETKAKRRLTLSICGLGMLDETEVDSVRRLEAEAAQLEVADKYHIKPPTNGAEARQAQLDLAQPQLYPQVER